VNARDVVLGRIHSALDGAAAAPSVARNYRTQTGGPAGSQQVVARFVDRLHDYGASVHLTTSDAIPETIAQALSGAASAVLPPRLPPSWRVGVEEAVSTVLVDGEPDVLSAPQLDEVSAVVTGCRVAIAETGTIVLDAGPDQGRRAITLVPDHHVAVVLARQVVAGVPEAIGQLDPSRPLTFISGPSATSDIEFSRVEGVHGPRRLAVVLVQPDAGAAATG
jgi:L-lactate dehydrogenase complex protein LldG